MHEYVFKMKKGDIDIELSDNNFFQLSFILFDLMKRQIFSGMLESEINHFEEILLETNKLVQFSEKIFGTKFKFYSITVNIF